MQKKTYYLFFFILLITGFRSMAQTKAAAIGKVLSSSGEAISNATIEAISVKSKTKAVVSSNDKGIFEFNNLSTDDKYNLFIRHVGFQPDSIMGFIVKANRSNSLLIRLSAKQATLDEVVVIGYGAQRRSEITSAISSVKKESFIKGAVQDAAQLLQGKVAGLGVTVPNGNPTSNSQVSLRGVGTLLSGSTPLVIIDGVPGDLNTVAPEDIESIDVLKDGSAAAIYGTRGNNGVILVTTNKVRGVQSGAEIQSYISTQTIQRRLNMMNAEQYRELVEQKKPGAIDYGYSVDWLDEVLRKPVTSVTNANLYGGTTASNYIANFNYRSAEGIIKRSDNHVITTRLEANHAMFDNLLKFNFNIMGRQQDFQALGDGNSFNGDIYRNALIGNPTDRVKDDNGNWVEHPVMNGYMNPLAAIYESDGKNKSSQVRTFGSVTLTPIKPLFIRGLLSRTVLNETRGYSESKKHISNIRNKRNGYASRGTSRKTEDLLELTTQYQQNFGAHHITALAGYSYQKDQYEDYYMNNWDFPSDQYSYNNMGAGAALRRGEAGENSLKNENLLIGFFGRLNYNFDNRYFISASLRHEGSSKFGKNHKWGSFPGVSVSWNPLNEYFMKGNDTFTNLKFRAGFGVTGTVPNDPYMSLRKLNTGDNFYTVGGWIPTIKPSSNANPDLRWEKKEEWNIGLDYGVLNNRIKGSIDYYKRTTKDMLWQYNVPMPPYLYDNMVANAGTMENKGLEVQISANPIRKESFTWNSTINYSTNKNKLVSLSNAQFQVHTGFIDAGWTGEPIQKNTHRIYEGGEMGNFWGFKTVGVDDDGRWLILDRQGNSKSILNQTDDDRQKIGNGLPKHLLSWDNQFVYKSFDLNITMRGAFSYDILNMPRMFYEVPVSLTRGNLLADAYQPKYGKVLSDQQELQYVDYFVEKGDFWKIDNLTLGFNHKVKDKFFKSMRFYFSTNNLWTITGYKGIDPEVNRYGLDPGVDVLGRYPSTRSFTFGTMFNF
ncbi:SusC/RagA family TonB-linked outer membrane protein [Sphingobacterium sp. UBA1498]|uniref:SusC/RagA family TonB-linked outer membrane protein n=1 Tax=Sphingobacterium sp. UBA1498 TaxID=1947481 RepID=UPI0025CEFE06|nr:SusC/RagA family TonB-linked outer membrane protein [Sphingobacterium sp. UBA1498]